MGASHAMTSRSFQPPFPQFSTPSRETASLFQILFRASVAASHWLSWGHMPIIEPITIIREPGLESPDWLGLGHVSSLGIRGEIGTAQSPWVVGEGGGVLTGEWGALSGNRGRGCWAAHGTRTHRCVPGRV